MKRADFLERIAARLGRPGVRTQPARAAASVGVPAVYRADPLAGGPADLAERFRRELEAVGGRVVRVGSIAAVAPALRALLGESGARRIVTHARSELAGFAVDALLDELGALAWDGGDAAPDRTAYAAAYRAACAAADVGITAAQAAVASSGSLLLCASSARPRSTSLLPALHVALVHEHQLVARLGQAFERALIHPGPGSATLLVTGPSRTSDIENDLTIGVHGPATVTVVLVGGHP
jgi:L-lactate dehydrogenase complex protein LldG